MWTLCLQPALLLHTRTFLSFVMVSELIQ
jgi:hypothetical protein